MTNATKITFADKSQSAGRDPQKFNAQDINEVKKATNDNADLVDIIQDKLDIIGTGITLIDSSTISWNLQTTQRAKVQIAATRNITISNAVEFLSGSLAVEHPAGQKINLPGNTNGVVWDDLTGHTLLTFQYVFGGFIWGSNISAAPVVGSDTDAQNYFAAIAGQGGVVSATEKSAYTSLVQGLKSDGLYTGIVALSPYLGATASSQKLNGVAPQDTDAAHRLAFSGPGVTHQQGYAQTDGSTGTYINTNLANNALATLNKRFSVWLNSTAAANADVWQFGIYTQSTDDKVFALNMASNTNDMLVGTGSSGKNIGNSHNLAGFYTLMVVADGSNNPLGKVYFNGNLLTTITTTEGIAAYATALSFYIGALNKSDGTSFRNSPVKVLLHEAGSSLTDSQVIQLYNRYQAFINSAK